MNPEWKAKLENTLSLSKSIISGNAQLVQIEMGLSIEETFSKPTVRSVFKDEAGVIGFSVVKVLITRFLESFGFSKQMNDSQIESLTVDTLENFQYESLHDIILFLKMARSGKFGTTQRGVDSNLIFGDWYPKYLEQKAILREQEYQKNKSVSSRIQPTDADVELTYKKIKESNFEKRVQEHVDHITKNYDRQMLEDLIVDWEKDNERKPFVHLLKAKRKSIK